MWRNQGGPALHPVFLSDLFVSLKNTPDPEEQEHSTFETSNMRLDSRLPTGGLAPGGALELTVNSINWALPTTWAPTVPDPFQESE